MFGSARLSSSFRARPTPFLPQKNPEKSESPENSRGAPDTGTRKQTFFHAKAAFGLRNSREMTFLAGCALQAARENASREIGEYAPRVQSAAFERAGDGRGNGPSPARSINQTA